MKELSIIGHEARSIDTAKLATGQATFGPDIKRPDMLYCKVLRSPVPHARIRAIRTEKARQLPGVKAVITADDIPDRLYGFWLRDLRVLARDKVRYVGDPMAAVAAIDAETAQKAIELIEFDLEELPAVFDPVEAAQPDAPLIHEEWESYEEKYDLVRYGNVCSHTTIVTGDIEQGFREADYIFEHTFRTKHQHQAYIEPHVTTVEVDSTGHITIWTSTQRVFLVREQVSESLGIPLSKIRVIGTTHGGGFGGKETLLEPILVLLAQKTNRPVRWIFTREEEHIAGRPRHASISRLKTGVKADGTIVARQAEIYYDKGAYADTGPGVTAVGALFAVGPYRVPNARVDAKCVYTNKVISGAFRAYGNPQATFAVEVQMDLIARALNIDPFELRRKNILVDGDELITGQRLRSVGALETLDAVAAMLDWPNVERGEDEGWGIATMIRPCGMVGSSAMVKVNEDGTAHLLTGAMDLGTNSRTTLAMIVAEELGIALEDVTVISADTDTTPYDYGSIASRIIFSVGNAVRAAAIAARDQIFEVAAPRLESEPENLRIENGRVFAVDNPGYSIPLANFSVQKPGAGTNPLLAHGRFIPPNDTYDRSRMRGYPMPAFPAFASTTQAFKVKVDRETGKVDILRVVAAQDVGKALNPRVVEGQILGGLIQGLGYATMEDYVFDEGRVLNRSLYDYRVPTSMDVPPIEIEMIEKLDPIGPYGAKGVGEPSIVPPPPAISNAIGDAVGVWPAELPITAERVYWLLHEQENGSSAQSESDAEQG